jgi:hypothetical protein
MMRFRTFVVLVFAVACSRAEEPAAAPPPAETAAAPDASAAVCI